MTARALRYEPAYTTPSTLGVFEASMVGPGVVTVPWPPKPGPQHRNTLRAHPNPRPGSHIPS